MATLNTGAEKTPASPASQGLSKRISDEALLVHIKAIHAEVKQEYGRRFATRCEAMDEVMDWLNFYNHKRLHSTLGYVSPMTFEQRWTADQQQDRKSA